MPRIVVLDGYTLNPGDLDWRPLRALGELEVHDRCEPHEVARRAEGAPVVLTNKVALDRPTIAALGDLRYIGVLATGYNIVDVAAAHQRGIVVTNVPAYGTESVSQMVFAHILELTNHVGALSRDIARRWPASIDWCYWDKPLVELAGLTLGVVGLGRIGRDVARIGQSFGMTVIAHNGRPPEQLPSGVTMVDLHALFQQSDVVTLHCPLTPQTQHLVNASRIALMKSNAILINTARGGLVHEHDLAAALNAGRIAGAGLDVLSVEPPTANNPLLTASNCNITPHVAWAARSSRQRLLDIAADNIRAFLAGSPQNCV